MDDAGVMDNAGVMEVNEMVQIVSSDEYPNDEPTVFVPGHKTPPLNIITFDTVREDGILIPSTSSQRIDKLNHLVTQTFYLCQS